MFSGAQRNELDEMQGTLEEVTNLVNSEKDRLENFNSQMAERQKEMSEAKAAISEIEDQIRVLQVRFILICMSISINVRLYS